MVYAIDRAQCCASDIYIDALDGSEPRLVASGIDVAWLPAAGATLAPTFSPTEAPSPSQTVSPKRQGLDIGLDFLLCDAASLGGVDLLGDGTDGTASTGTKARPDGTCPPGGTDTAVVAYDSSGDGRADIFDQYGMAYCIGCEPFGTTDLNGDGIDELVVLSQGGTEIQYELFQADIREGNVWFGPVFIVGPGDGLGLQDRWPLHVLGRRRRGASGVRGVHGRWRHDAGADPATSTHRRAHDHDPRNPSADGRHSDAGSRDERDDRSGRRPAAAREHRPDLWRARLRPLGLAGRNRRTLARQPNHVPERLQRRTRGATCSTRPPSGSSCGTTTRVS